MRRFISATLLVLGLTASAQAAFNIRPMIELLSPNKGTAKVRFSVHASYVGLWGEDLDFRCQYFVDDQCIWDTRHVGTVSLLNPYETWDVVHRVCLDSGQHTFKLLVDVDNDEAESNEQDNGVLLLPPPWERANWTFLVYMNATDSDDEEFREAAWQSIVEATPQEGEANVVVMRDRRQIWDYIVNVEFGYPDLDHYRRGCDLWIPQDLDPGLGGEFQMGNGEWLKAFLTWGVRNFPADHYAVVLYDHGDGWQSVGPTAASLDTVRPQGIMFDEDPGPEAYISTRELGEAMHAMACAKWPTSPYRPCDVLYLDACFMQMTEVAYEVRNSVNYMVGSEAVSHSYKPDHKYRNTISEVTGTTDDLTLARSMAKYYHEEHVRTWWPDDDHTVSVLCLAKFGLYKGYLDAFADELRRAWGTHHWWDIAIAHGETQDFGDPDVPYSYDYIDIFDFAIKVRDTVNTGDAQGQALHAAAAALADGWLWSLLVPCQYEDDYSGAYGLSIYLPSNPQSVLYGYYNANSLSFVADPTVRWDDWVRTHHGEQFIVWTRLPCGSPNPVDSGGQVQLDVAAEGNLGHEVDYWWYCNEGAFVGHPGQQRPVWTAPINRTDSVLTCNIKARARCTLVTPIVEEFASYPQQVRPAPHEMRLTAGASADPNPVASGGQVQCSVSADCGRDGHGLTYQWAATMYGHDGPAGSFNDATAREPVWTAPTNLTEEGADCTLTVTVTCAQDASVSASDELTVIVLPVEHVIQITAEPVGEPNPVASGDQVQCSVTAQCSREGHGLTYQWTATQVAGVPAGSFDDATASAPVWTAPTNLTDAAAEYTLAVTVTCAEDPSVSASGSFVQQVEPIAHAVTITMGPLGDPSPVASGGQVQCSLSAQCSREGHSLTYQWPAPHGAGVPAGSFDDATAREPVWTAPTNLTDAAAEYTLAVTVTCAEDPSVSASGSFVQQVEPVAHAVTISAGPTAEPSPVAAGDPVACSVSAQDSREGHELGYAWTATDPDGAPAGSFDDATAREPVWTAPAVAAPAEFTISVVVSCAQDSSISASGNAAVTVLPSLQHAFPGGIAMVSLPLVPMESQPMAELLGASALAAWDATQQRYVADAPVDAAANLGVGCSARFEGEHPIQVAGTPHPAESFSRPLAPNWNLMALPWGEALAFGALSSQPAEQILAHAWTYYDGNYHLVAPIEGLPEVLTQFEPWRCYWVFATGECELVLTRTAPAASISPLRLAGTSADGGWAIQVVASVAGAADSANYCGVSASAADLRILEPPTAPGGVELYFPREDGGRRALDLRAALPPEGAQWRFEVAAPAGRQVTVACPDLSGVPRELAVYLVDEDGGQTTYLRTSAGYRYTAHSEAPRHFLLRVAEASGSALVVGAMTAQQASAGAVSISYTLSAPARVSIEVLNIAGRCICRLEQSDLCAAGVHSATWNLRAQDGRRVPAGTFLLRATASAEDGRQASALTTVTLRR
ncbi:MAG: clostripain-related cysteine peptidase [Armatimonadota bacterium]